MDLASDCSGSACCGIYQRRTPGGAASERPHAITLSALLDEWKCSEQGGRCPALQRSEQNTEYHKKPPPLALVPQAGGHAFPDWDKAKRKIC